MDISGTARDQFGWPPEGLKKMKLEFRVRCGVYFLILKGAVVYVGSSENIYSRVATHCATRKFDSVMFLEIELPRARAVERHWILTLKPPLNGWTNSKGTRFLNAPPKEKVIPPPKWGF